MEQLATNTFHAEHSHSIVRLSQSPPNLCENVPCGTLSPSRKNSTHPRGRTITSSGHLESSIRSVPRGTFLVFARFWHCFHRGRRTILGRQHLHTTEYGTCHRSRQPEGWRR